MILYKFRDDGLSIFCVHTSSVGVGEEKQWHEMKNLSNSFCLVMDRTSYVVCLKDMKILWSQNEYKRLNTRIFSGFRPTSAFEASWYSF